MHEEPDRRRSPEVLEGAALAPGLFTRPGERLVRLVDEHPRPGLDPQALGDTDVIDMTMRQDERADVPGLATHRGERRSELRPVPRQARVHDRQAGVGLDEIPVDERAPEPDDTIRDGRIARGSSHEPERYTRGVNAGIGLIVLAVIFAFGVVLFGLLAISMLPGAVLLEDRLREIRTRRTPPERADEPAE